MEIKTNLHINEIIIRTQNAFRKIDIKWQNTYRYLSANELKKLMKTINKT